MMARIRLFESPLHDVRYVYGRPVPFPTDPETRRETLDRYGDDKEAAEKKEEAREAAAAERAVQS